VLTTQFYTIEPPARPVNPYDGDPLAELNQLRESCARVLAAAYPTAVVNDSPGPSVSISGGSLRRKIDVVISNWWDTNEYQSLRKKVVRGVRVFDSKAYERIDNRPFLHNARIEERDAALAGNVRKVARLLKSVKYDADTNVDISSYDITSIAYRMPEEFMRLGHGEELALVENTRMFLRFLVDTPSYRDSLRVPNEMRPIFGGKGATVAGLSRLYQELQDLVDDINRDLARSLRKLEEARVSY